MSLFLKSFQRRSLLSKVAFVTQSLFCIVAGTMFAVLSASLFCNLCFGIPTGPENADSCGSPGGHDVLRKWAPFEKVGQIWFFFPVLERVTLGPLVGGGTTTPLSADRYDGTDLSILPTDRSLHNGLYILTTPRCARRRSADGSLVSRMSSLLQ